MEHAKKFCYRNPELLGQAQPISCAPTLELAPQSD